MAEIIIAIIIQIATILGGDANKQELKSNEIKAATEQQSQQQQPSTTIEADGGTGTWH